MTQRGTRFASETDLSLSAIDGSVAKLPVVAPSSASARPAIVVVGFCVSESRNQAEPPRRAQVTSKLLVLDLDETLIYGTQQELTVAPNFVVGDYFIYERPYLREFLDYCLAEFRVAVWTSASDDYAVQVVSQLLGSVDKLVFLWARDRCTLQFDHREYVHLYTKNLKKAKRLGYALEQIVVVDNTAEKWSRQYGNLVQVADFEGDQSDNELVDLRAYLTYLNGVEDVRSIEKRGWRLKMEWRRV